MPKVKVCYINSLEEAELAIRSGVSANGLDVCSGLKSQGTLNASKIQVYFKEIQ